MSLTATLLTPLSELIRAGAQFRPVPVLQLIQHLSLRFPFARSDFAFMPPAASKIPPPVCKHCDVTMALIGKLPSVQHHPEVRVFRCYSCNHVASEEL
jgi:hypothetical protein